MLTEAVTFTILALMALSGHLAATAPRGLVSGRHS
ncbi:hypothetical protein BDB13_2451 [Rhodococcus sp. OK302]|nr:hypothetical protein BDB13_2451 [Rhodococcus sp. OK302]